MLTYKAFLLVLSVIHHDCLIIDKRYNDMGGHSAWRKRVEAGELAKGRGGAIARHRPHFGRKGEDLKLNRKGNIAGGNPKKSKSTKSQTNPQDQHLISQRKKTTTYLYLRRFVLVALLAFLSASVAAAIYRLFIQ